MQMPPRSPDIETAKERFHAEIAKWEQALGETIADIAKSGISDKRWCAIALTHVQEGFMALHRALRDYPGDNPNEYGKVATAQPMPQGFVPDVDTQTNTAPPDGPPHNHQVEWKDHGADGST